MNFFKKVRVLILAASFALAAAPIGLADDLMTMDGDQDSAEGGCENIIKQCEINEASGGFISPSCAKCLAEQSKA